MTDPKGLQFMTHYPSIIDDEPARIELWQEDEAWSRELVEKGVRRTCTTNKYTVKQCDDWQAMFDFHNQHKGSDYVTTMPCTWRTSSGEAIDIDGGPLQWGAMWRALRRFPRAHHRTPADGSEGDARATDETEVESDVQPRDVPLALWNSVTGIERPKNERRKAVKLVSERARVDSMDLSLDLEEMEQMIEADKRLFFIKLAHFEGDFKVGICHVDSIEENGEVAVSWYVWVKGSAKKTRVGWGPNPRFQPYKQPRSRKLCKTVEDFDVFLPVPVQPTKSSKLPTEGSITNSTIRLTKQCVDQLRDFCHVRRPDLVAETTAEGSASEDGEGGSVPEQSASEESASEESASEESVLERAPSQSASDSSDSASEKSHCAEGDDQPQGGLPDDEDESEVEDDHPAPSLEQVHSRSQRYSQRLQRKTRRSEAPLQHPSPPPKPAKMSRKPTTRK